MDHFFAFVDLDQRNRWPPCHRQQSSLEMVAQHVRDHPDLRPRCSPTQGSPRRTAMSRSMDRLLARLGDIPEGEAAEAGRV